METLNQRVMSANPLNFENAVKAALTEELILIRTNNPLFERVVGASPITPRPVSANWGLEAQKFKRVSERPPYQEVSWKSKQTPPDHRRSSSHRRFPSPGRVKTANAPKFPGVRCYQCGNACYRKSSQPDLRAYKQNDHDEPARYPDSRSSAPSRCFGCKKPGHILRYCTQAKCFNCQQPGHLRSKCHLNRKRVNFPSVEVNPEETQ